jgi:hypothetical protein
MAKPDAKRKSATKADTKRKTKSNGSVTPFDPSRAVVADATTAEEIKNAAGLALEPASATAAASAAAAIKPGKERWSVKTGQDSGASKVGLKPGSAQHVIVETTVEELVKMPRPKGMTNIKQNSKDFQSRRAGTVEFTVWRITAEVFAVKNEDDGDLHLALRGASGETMIAESTRPDAKFVGKSPWLSAVRDVRDAIQGELSTALAGVTLVLGTDGKFVPPESFDSSRLAAASVGPPIDAATALAQGLSFKSKIDPRKARITGVGFFDKVHGQLGVSSSNGIELHPILDFVWL